MVAAAVLASAIAAAGCFDPKLPSVACGPEGQCPDGLSCNESSGICGGGDSIDAGAVAVAWWDTEFRYRRNIRINEAITGTLAEGYSIALTDLHTAAGVDAGKMRPDGADIRIVRHSEADDDELDRHLLAMNTSATTVWLKTQAPIDTTSDEYFLYYGNPTADPAPAYWSDSMGADAPSRVYLAADDFEEHADGECPDGWTSCGTEWSITDEGDGPIMTSAANGQFLLAGDPDWGDIALEARIRSDDPAGCPGVATRAEDESNLVYVGYDCNPNNVAPPKNISAWSRVLGGYSLLFFEVVTIGTEWHTLGVAMIGSEIRLYHDGIQVSAGSATDSVPNAGQVGLFSTYGTNLFADDVIVRAVVDPEPTASLGAEQSVE